MDLCTSLTLKYLKENKKRTIITIIGVILSAALICGIGNIFESLMDYQIRETANRKGMFHITFNEVRNDNIKYIEQNAEVDKIALSNTVGSAMVNPNFRKMLNIKAYDENAFDGFQIKLKEGKIAKNSEEIVLSEEIISTFEKPVKVGDTITLEVGTKANSDGYDTSENSLEEGDYIKDSKSKTYKVVGIAKSPGFEHKNGVAYGFTYLDPEKKNDFELINVSCLVKNPKEIYINGEKIGENADINKEDISYNDHLLNLLGASKYQHVSSAIIMAVILVTSLVIICTIVTVYNGFSISIVERKKQFGVLASIGATKSQIIKMVLTEGLLVSIIGIPIGLICGTFAIDILFKFIQNYFADYSVASLGLRVIFSPKIMIVSTLIVLATIFIAVMIPAISASKISPLEAIRNSGDFKFKKIRSSKLVKLIFKTEGELAYKNIKRNRKRFISIILSLVMSIVIFISFSGFMKIMLTAQRIRTGEINYNIDVSAVVSDDKNNSNITKEIIKELDKLDTVKNYSAYELESNLNLAINIKEDNLNKNLKEEEKELFNSHYPKETIGEDIVYKTNSNTLRFPGDKAINSINLKSGTFDKDEAIDQNGVILINKSYYEQPGKRGEVTFTNYKVGDTIEADFIDKDGKTKKTNLKIMAISEDKVVGDIVHNYLGLGFVTYDEVAKNLGIEELNKKQMYISCEDDENTLKVIEDLTKNYNWNFTNETEFMEDMNQTYFVMQIFVYGFIAVISLVSVTNIVNTISTNINLRKRELAIIKSIGVTPSGFNRMIYLESILYGVISLLFGIPLGVLLSMTMNRILANVISFSLVLPWEAILISIVAVFLITFVSAYIPMKKLNKENIIENIRQESI